MTDKETPKEEDGTEDKGKGKQDDPVRGTVFTQEQVNSFMAEEKRRYQDKLTEFEKEQKKLQEQLEKTVTGHGELENKLALAESNSLRFKVALEKGLPMEIALRLQGDDEDALKKDAEQLSTLIKTPGGKLMTGQGNDDPPPTEANFSDQIRKNAGFSA